MERSHWEAVSARKGLMPLSLAGLTTVLFFYDAGESINTEYKDNVRRIVGLDLISDSDKRDAIKRQHELATAALQAQAEAPSWAVTGRANLNVRASNSATQKAMTARGDMTEHVNSLIITSKTNVVAARNNARKIAVENALATGALEFTVNGETWRRSSKRSKTFQAVLF